MVPLRRDEGVLKRWRGTPLPTWVYLGGFICSAVIIAFVGVVVMLTLGVVAYDLDIEAAKMPAAFVTFLVGVASFAALGHGARRAREVGEFGVGGGERDHPAARVRVRCVRAGRRSAALARDRRQHLPAQAVRPVVPGLLQPDGRGAGVRLGGDGVRRAVGPRRSRAWRSSASGGSRAAQRRAVVAPGGSRPPDEIRRTRRSCARARARGARRGRAPRGPARSSRGRDPWP